MASQSENITVEIKRADKQTTIKERLKVLLRYVYAVKVESEFRKKIREECYGCETDHPSQLQHTCLEPEISWGPGHRIYLYTEAEYAVSKGYLEALFVETGNILRLDSNLIDFRTVLKEILESWETENFKQIERDIDDAPLTYDTATLEAALKLDRLESRFKRLSLEV